MARKHEKFQWIGYKYAPETFKFFLNGKRLNLSEEDRSKISYLAACGRKKEVSDELKRVLRKEEKKPIIIGKCICFFKENSDEYYYTQQLMYNHNNIQDALGSYKEWKRYIKSKNNVLENGYELMEGQFTPFGKNKGKAKIITNNIDLNRCGTVTIIRETIFD